MPATVHIELNSFTVLTRETRRWPGKKLRFSVAIIIRLTPVNEFDVPETLDFEIAGCLASINDKGELYWSPPMSRSGSYYANNIFVSQDVNKRVLATLTTSKYYEILKADRLQTTFTPAQLDAPEKLEVP